MGTGTGSPGKWSWHQPDRVHEMFGQCSQAHGVILGDGAGHDGGCCRARSWVPSKLGYSLTL